MFRVIYLFPFFIIIFYKIDTRSLLYQQLASRRPMFGKRSRKENSCRANLLFVFKFVFLIRSQSLERGMTQRRRRRFFPDEDVFCHRFTSERREGNKGEKWREYGERERRRDATLGELSLARERCGCDGSLMLLPPLSRGSA